MSEWYFRHKATMACFFLVFAVFCFAVAAKAGAAQPATATTPGSKVTFAQQYVKALCLGIRHSEPPAQRKSTWIQKCTVGPVYGKTPGQMYYVYVVSTQVNVQHYIQVLVDSGANIAAEKLIWTHKLAPQGPKA